MPSDITSAGRLTLAPLLAATVLLAAAPATLATFPGHNGRVAFHAATDAGTEIFTVRPNGRDLRQITHVDGDARMPDWSPDGRRIAFTIETENSSRIAIMNADGSDLVVVPAAPGTFEGDPSFTPDGDRLVIDRFDGETGALWSMRLDGSDRRITAASGADPNVSPDGRRLAFLGFDGAPFGQALFTSAIDGGSPTALTPFSFNVGFKLDWSPDGRRLTFIHNADFAHPGESANIATIRPDGTGLRFVTNYRGGDVNAFFGSYSPDGRWISLRLEDHGRTGLYKMRPDGSHLRPILESQDVVPRFIDWGTRPKPHPHGDDDR